MRGVRPEAARQVKTGVREANRIVHRVFLVPARGGSIPICAGMSPRSAPTETPGCRARARDGNHRRIRRRFADKAPEMCDMPLLSQRRRTPLMIKRDLPYEGLLHEVVEHNGVLYIGGIVPEDTSLDMSGQAKDVLTQLTQLLKNLGSDPANVLQVTIYMTDLKEKAEFNAVWKAHFAELDLPARAAIGVADLGPGVKLEMTAIAAMS
jgi:enamine deaminase RidA (YjgF/YER057c/UK114 family)